MLFAIIDDEKAARDELRYLLNENFKEINIIEFINGQQMLDYSQIEEIDVAFVDMNLGDYDGLTIGKKLKEINQEINIIFATAYDQYALDSFEIGTFDYITKPLDPKRFNILVNRLKNHFKTIEYAYDHELEKLSISYNKKTKFIDINKIVYIESANRKTYIYTIDKEEIPTTEKMQDLEDKLSHDKFFRIHKSYIINLDHISSLEYYGHNSYDIRMKHYTSIRIPISRNKIRDFKTKIEI
ncbi:LytR/AlgR family response regulator transcription factor [Mycoplasma sp. P36-A1]|uniref:LytR/AlgR family response regulator transcription factor n=1 Tax=Mycoplasma sp. P36-A1 TaxID=3252900 RepID=UPI003C2AC302